MFRRIIDVFFGYFTHVKAELIRSAMSHIELGERGIKMTCTMFSSTAHCAIQGSRGNKWPKLEELHQKLFGEGFEGAHDALVDVQACARCFFELKRLGVIKE
jgi:DNA polymerase III epsilon subunit-like protein